MDMIIAADRAVTRAIARALRAVEQRTGWPMHPLAFWGVAGLYMVVWVILCAFEDQPQWMWYLVGAGMGTVAAYVADHEPAAVLEDGVALTHFGLDSRWSLLRLIYAPLALALTLPLLLSGQYTPLFVALLLLDIGLFALLEYLLTFRLLPHDHPLLQLHRLFEQGQGPVPETPDSPDVDAPQ